MNHQETADQLEGLKLAYFGDTQTLSNILCKL